MTSGSRSGPVLELLTARAKADGGHTSNQLAPQVRKGQLLRLRRGVYVEARSWINAAPWQKYRATIAAAAWTHDPIFCRQAALLLHEVPLFPLPTAVTVRTLRPGGCGRLKPPSLTGALSAEGYCSQYRRHFPDEANVHASRLRNIPTHRLHPALVAGQSRAEALDAVRNGELPLQEKRVRSPVQAEVCGPGSYRVEPLGLALVDTVSRMPFEEAIVALDWAKAQCPTEVMPWLDYLSNGRMRRRWELAWEFADPLSESPGESRSRAAIHRQGFGAPSLQVDIPTDAGTFRVDFCWEDEGVIGEFDGKAKYVDDRLLKGRDPREAVFEEKRREDALRRAGWRVVRWTWADLNDPVRLAQYLARSGVSRSM